MHTGVKSAGCEKRIAQEPPSHEWKSMSPWVVFAWKFGASLPRRRRGCSEGIDEEARWRRGTKGDGLAHDLEVDSGEVIVALGKARRGACVAARAALRAKSAAMI